MDLARMHEGIRRMRFLDVLGRTEHSELSHMEAAELLGVSERTFRRWRDPHCDEGEAGLADRRLRPSPRRAPVAEIERMLGLHRDLYRGFTVQHFHEQLGRGHGYTLGYTVIKLHLLRAGLVTPARTRSAHRKKRPRRPMVGMLLHQDASTPAWLRGNTGKQDLEVAREDATSEKVRVHEYPDARLAVFLGPHRLADYAPNGSIIPPARTWAAAVRVGSCEPKLGRR
jgi:transposase